MGRRLYRDQLPFRIKRSWISSGRCCGSTLFQQITEPEEYDPTRCERAILLDHGGSLGSHVGRAALRLIELGAGDGHKTEVVLDHRCGAGIAVTYHPIDICPQVLDDLAVRLRSRMTYPDLEIAPIPGEYPSALPRAYDDPQGVTREFNLNLLDQLNRELGADFQRDRFLHHCEYHAARGRMESWLVSKTPQEVRVAALARRFSPAALGRRPRGVLPQVRPGSDRAVRRHHRLRCRRPLLRLAAMLLRFALEGSSRSR